MNPYMKGRHDAFTHIKEALDIVDGLPSEMQLVMIRGYVARMLRKYEQPTLREIEEAAA